MMSRWLRTWLEIQGICSYTISHTKKFRRSRYLFLSNISRNATSSMIDAHPWFLPLPQSNCGFSHRSTEFILHLGDHHASRHHQIGWCTPAPNDESIYSHSCYSNNISQRFECYRRNLRQTFTRHPIFVLASFPCQLETSHGCATNQNKDGTMELCFSIDLLWQGATAKSL